MYRKIKAVIRPLLKLIWALRDSIFMKKWSYLEHLYIDQQSLDILDARAK